MKFASLMEERAGPPTSESAIREIGQRIISEVIGGNASLAFQQAVETAVLPLLQGHLEVSKIPSKAFFTIIPSIMIVMTNEA